MFLPFQPWKIPPSTIRGRGLVLLVLAGFACATILSVASFAQQPSPNVNVLPASPSGNASPPFPPLPISLTDAMRGDGYLQRQVEPVVATSTFNPDHILAAFNDYRRVDIPNDTGLPGSAVSGWIGLSRSYDRGHTWFGSIVPCFPGDTAAICASSPLTGLQASSDPSLATTPGGHFYLGGLFFTPGGISNVAVIHYRDVPDTDGGDAIHYIGAVTVDKSSQSDSGNFNDKPAAAGDVARGTTSASVCGPVYIAYTIFTGGGGSVPFTSKLGFSRSKQGKCGVGWDNPQYLNKNFKQNQGAAITVDPTSGKIYVVWRHVFQAGGDGFPDSILMVTSSDGGGSFSSPVPITPSSFAPFDQPELSTTNFPSNPAFRSNSFPTIAVDGNGNVYVADQEKTFPTIGNYPPGYYEPRIIIYTSTTGGGSWTKGSVVDVGTSSSTNPPITSAQQFMPVLSFGGGLLKLMWYDFREQSQLSDKIAGGYFITGFDRQMKTYVAQTDLSLHDGNGNPMFSPSVPVTKYLIEPRTGKIPTVGNAGLDPAVNRPNLPMYSGGTNAFTGDYIGQMSAAPFVPNLGGTTPFRWATKPTDYIAMPSFGVWTDSRDVVFPTSPMGGGTTPMINDLAGWQTYAPPGKGQLSCVNAGARNANVYLSEIKPGVVAGSPATSRQLVDANGKPIERAFPMYIQNPNADAPGQQTPGKFFRVSFNNLGSPVAGSFDQGTELTKPTNSLDLQILQYSSSAVTLYVFCTGCSSSLPFVPFQVTVQHITGLGGQVISDGPQTAIFFDSDPTAPFVTNPNLGTNEIHDVTVSNPQFDNPQFDNPQFDNPQFDNPQFDNIAPVEAQPVGDFVYQVTAAGNNASAYTAVVNVAQSTLTNRYVYELIIAKTYNFPGFNACDSQPIPQGSIISIIPNPQFDNPQFDNPQFDNPQFDNPQFDNATFATVPPPPGSTGTAAALSTASTSTSTSSGDGTTKMPLGTDHVYVVLRVYRPAGVTPTPLSLAEQGQITANTSLLVFPQAPNTGTGTPTVQPPAPASSNKILTTTALTSSQSASVFGQPVTFTATVTPKSGLVTPTGTVDFKDSSTLLQTVPLSGGVASVIISSLAVGTHIITAVYSGDATFDGSLNLISQKVASVLAITTSTLPNAIVGVPYGPQQLNATGGTLPYCWSNSANTCPVGSVPIGNGFLINAGGQITGTPLQPGITPLTVFVTDNGPPIQTAFSTINIAVNGNVVNTNDSGPGSLRQAILDVNSQSSPQPVGIVFNIPGSGVHTITPSSALPTLTQPAIIDATTQPGFAGTPVIELNGGSAGAAANGLHVSAGNTTVRGFVIGGFGGDGVLLDTNGSDVIQGNYVGTDTTGTVAHPNGNGIQIIATPNNMIGGSAGLRNIISGNQGEGVRIDGTLATGNVVQGNYIGTDPSGSAAVGNSASGVFLRHAPGNSVLGNLISGNTGFAGITICGNAVFCGGGDISGIDETSNAAGNVVKGNFVGTNAAGTAALGNSQAGVSIDGAPNTVVGGTFLVGIRNVISFNGTNDVQIFSAGASGNKIVGNTIQGSTTATTVGISVGIFSGAAAGTGNTLSLNSISGHAGIGIDLTPAGVNPNTPGGANNFPVLTSAQLDPIGNTTINGTLNSTANASFSIEFFSNTSCNGSGNGEGAIFLGSAPLTTDVNGNASFTQIVSGPAAGNAITSTATDAGGTTSEFSACTSVTSPPPPATTAVNLTPTSAGTLTPGQSFNETRAADVKVLTAGPLTVSSMTLGGLNIGSSASSALAGARIYDSSSGALVASGDATVNAGSQQTITIPIAATLASGATYRVGFYVQTNPTGSGSGTVFVVTSFPYTESTGRFQVVAAWDSSPAGDVFPTTTNTVLPQMTITVAP